MGGEQHFLVEWFMKFTLLLLLCWLGHFLLKSFNPRWRVWLWRTGAFSIVALLFALPWHGLIQFVIPVGESATIAPSTWNTTAAIAVGNNSDVQSSHQREPTAMTARRWPKETGGSPSSATELVVRRQPGQAVPSGRSTTPRRAAQPLNSTDSNSTTPINDRAEAPVPSAAWHRNTPLRNSIDGQVALILIWLLGVLVGLVRWVAGEIRLSRILHLAVPLDERKRVLMRPLAQKLGLDLNRVLLTSSLRSPSVAGCLRPVILIAHDMFHVDDDPLSQHNDIRAAIVHEWVHIQGRDSFWDRIMHVLTIAVWFHPLVWRIRATHRDACERVCDVLSSDLIEDREAYKGSLARIALRLARRVPEPGIAMARCPDVVDRLRALTPDATAKPLGRGRILVGLSILFCAGLLGTTSVVLSPRRLLAVEVPSNVADANVDQTKKQEIATPVLDAFSVVPEFRLKVLAADDSQPIANAKVEFRLYGKDVRFRKSYETDEAGEYLFEYPPIPQTARMSVTIRLAGYVPYQVDFGRSLTEASVPAEKTVRLQRGVAVGGVVVDGRGKAGSRCGSGPVSAGHRNELEKLCV